jgi:hypothetical protein
MRFDFYGLAFETPRVTFHLWSPWRATALEHRLFDALRNLPRVELEEAPDELRLHVSDPRACRSALHAVSRVLKGWQEEAEPGSERRSWRWLLEGDTDDAGYDANGEATSLWAFVRLGLERGGVDEPEKGEDIDLNWFGLQVPGNSATFGEG